MHPGSRGSFLDHVWTDLQWDDIVLVTQHLRLDNDSIHHRAIMFKYLYRNQQQEHITINSWLCYKKTK